MNFTEVIRLIGTSAPDALQILSTGPVAVQSIDFAYPEEALYLTAKHSGIELALDSEGSVSTIWLHSGRRTSHARYAGPLPSGVTFESDRNSVWAALGDPSLSGGKFEDAYIGQQGPWDRWDHSTHLLHVQYAFAEDTVELITVMRHDWAPGDGPRPRTRRWWQFWTRRGG